MPHSKAVRLAQKLAGKSNASADASTEVSLKSQGGTRGASSLTARIFELEIRSSYEALTSNCSESGLLASYLHKMYVYIYIYIDVIQSSLARPPPPHPPPPPAKNYIFAWVIENNGAPKKTKHEKGERILAKYICIWVALRSPAKSLTFSGLNGNYH